MTTTLPAPAHAAWRQGWTAFLLTSLARVVLGALAVLLAVSVLPVVIGWQSSVVLSGSMAPTLTVGDVAVVRPVAVAVVEPGQVLLVDDPDSPGELRLHRLVSVQPAGLQLKGDANAAADGSLVAPSAVHGVVTLGLPLVGQPAVWLAQGQVLPLAGTGLGLLALLALAVAHRRPEDDPPAAPPIATGRRRRPAVRGLRRGAVLASAVLVAVAVPGAGAAFSDTTASPALTFPVAAHWTCPDVVAADRATHYYRLQERSGTIAGNSGTTGAAGNATYGGTATSQPGGPNCGAGETRAVTLDGSSGYLWTTQAVANPQSFTTQLWFNTRTSRGGKLIGFGNGTNGDRSGSYDRHVYMTNAGQLVFGLYNGTIYTVTSPRTYNDGAWHLMTASFSAGSGMRLYVDGALVASGWAPAAEAITGYWRIGFDNLNTWPATPTSEFFGGSLAHVSIYDRVLSANDVREAWEITR
ncbi:signal peptidase I [uncultured Modestobacter sp.]|uniref:signal peptidase I n=1 Tax=uncultured Modestobacter sp. TaxID=380048 RepID=UPI002608F830|nr:signal peptidase I [uncultured Modestobacter sp.]